VPFAIILLGVMPFFAQIASAFFSTDSANLRSSIWHFIGSIVWTSMLGKTETEYSKAKDASDFVAKNIATSSALKEFSDPSSGARIFFGANNTMQPHSKLHKSQSDYQI
jgi:hypothetical protein